MTHDHDDPRDEQDGQVSELAEAGGEPDPISSGDSVAGQPDAESGEVQEGTQGPDAPPRHGIPEESNESSR
jgi:hypothetical protein